MLVTKYEELMGPVNSITYASNVKIGFGFGVSQFMMFACFAGMFFGGGIFLENIWHM